MTLGEKLRQARLERGLSQRQLCGDQITRNMLSQIENGAARPSMDTLRYLAVRLEKPVSWFLEDGASRAEDAFERGDWQAVLDAPEGTGEIRLMQQVARLHLARQMLDAGRKPYALRLLEDWTASEESLERQRLLLLAQIRPEMAQQLPSLDGELLIRARWALQMQDADRAAAFLDAAQDRAAPQWKLLRGQAECLRQNYAAGAEYLSGAEEAFPNETAQLLEVCYRELGDYKKAYHYACIQRKE